MKKEEIHYIKWWEWVLLFFRPSIISAEYGSDEEKVHGIICKELFGHHYIINEF